ncbi:MAG: hypothetical protein Q8R13_00270 [bacterium]|nr:hypothetical protein [bacterium]MDZ4296646.1 hypothetical protein [Patescibacteria group bacterium]
MHDNGVNLLPPERQAVLSRIFSHRLVIFYGKVLTTLLVFFAAELFVLGLAFRIEARALEERILADAATLEEFSALLEESRLQARRLSTVKAFLAQTAPLHPLLDAALVGIPDGIRLTNVQFRRDEARLTLAGRAPTRESLLEFEAQLKALPEVAQVAVPVSSFLKARDVDFVVNITFGEPAL